jgi:hypothetical protein
MALVPLPADTFVFCRVAYGVNIGFVQSAAFGASVNQVPNDGPALLRLGKHRGRDFLEAFRALLLNLFFVGGCRLGLSAGAYGQREQNDEEQKRLDGRLAHGDSPLWLGIFRQQRADYRARASE